MVTDEPPVAVESMPEEKKERLMAKLRQAISDEEECSVCRLRYLLGGAEGRSVSRYSRDLESPIVVMRVSLLP